MSAAPFLVARFAGRIGGFRLACEFDLAGQGITVLVGASGSGKTTVLRCIAGLQRLPGRLVVGGETWQDDRAFVPTHRRAVGYVFQEPSLLSHLSVQGNLDYARRRASPHPGVSYDEAVDLLGIAPLLPRSTTNLSGGERQRVAIARALMTHPALLLMDEPLASLDDASKAEIMPFLDRLHETLSLPILYVTHDRAEVRRLADHVLVMEGGRVTPAAVLDAAAAEAAVDRMTADELRVLAVKALLAGLE